MRYYSKSRSIDKIVKWKCHCCRSEVIWGVLSNLFCIVNRLCSVKLLRSSKGISKITEMPRSECVPHCIDSSAFAAITSADEEEQWEWWDGSDEMEVMRWKWWKVVQVTARRSHAASWSHNELHNQIEVRRLKSNCCNIRIPAACNMSIYKLMISNWKWTFPKVHLPWKTNWKWILAVTAFRLPAGTFWLIFSG